jgi:hypothetical protein
MLPFAKGTRILRDEGLSSFITRSGLYVTIPLWNTVTSRHPIGTNIFDQDWDLLIILDTCRIDKLQLVSKSVPWIKDIDQMQSVGSMSAEWMLNTFARNYIDDIADTAFISGNIWSHRIFNERFQERQNHDYEMIHRGFPSWNPVSSEDFAHYETVSAVANQDHRLHPENEAIPHILTDRAIDIGRTKSCERMIVHYTLPHMTFIADALDWEFRKTSTQELMNGLDVVRNLRPEEASYEPARCGKVPEIEVHDAYIQNLKLAIDYVDILLQNVNAENVIISADHGEALGEHGIWGHPYGYPFAPVKTVPWATASATDEQTYTSQFDQLERMPTEGERTEFLKQMGYL